MDAVNLMFARFQTAYHNQYHRAFPDDESLSIAKRYWLTELQGYSPRQIAVAAEYLTRTERYLPSLAVMVQACEQSSLSAPLPDKSGSALHDSGPAFSPKRLRARLKRLRAELKI